MISLETHKESITLTCTTENNDTTIEITVIYVGPLEIQTNNGLQPTHLPLHYINEMIKVCQNVE